MSAITDCVWYTLEPIPEGATIQEFLSLFPFEPIKNVWLYRAAGVSAQDERQRSECQLDAPRLLSGLTEESCLAIECNRLDHLHRIRQEVIDRIPFDIRDEFLPSEQYLVVGPHELQTVNFNAELVFVAHSWFSIHYWGYSIPDEEEMFGQAMAELTSVQDFVSRAKPLVGDLQFACLTDF